MWEVLLSLRKLRDDEGTLVFGEWRRRVRARWPTAADGLLALVPPRGYAPDFLTPVVMGGGFEQALAEILATPRGTMRADLRRLGRQQPLPASAQALADGDASALRELGRGRAIGPPGGSRAPGIGHQDNALGRRDPRPAQAGRGSGRRHLRGVPIR
jgi:hypothetical protein